MHSFRHVQARTNMHMHTTSFCPFHFRCHPVLSVLATEMPLPKPCTVVCSRGWWNALTTSCAEQNGKSPPPWLSSTSLALRWAPHSPKKGGNFAVELSCGNKCSQMWNVCVWFSYSKRSKHIWINSRFILPKDLRLYCYMVCSNKNARKWSESDIWNNAIMPKSYVLSVEGDWLSLPISFSEVLFSELSDRILLLTWNIDYTL